MINFAQRKIYTPEDLMKYQGKHKQTTTGMAVIIAQLKSFAIEIIKDAIPGPSVDEYYIKAGYKDPLFVVQLYNTEKQAVVEYSWLFSTILEKCKNKTIEGEFNMIIRKMVLKFEEKSLIPLSKGVNHIA